MKLLPNLGQKFFQRKYNQLKHLNQIMFVHTVEEDLKLTIHLVEMGMQNVILVKSQCFQIMDNAVKQLSVFGL